MSLQGNNGSSGLKPPSPGETYGVWGDTDIGMGVVGTSKSLIGVYGESENDDGVVGLSRNDSTGVLGFTFGVGVGVSGSSDGVGLYGYGESDIISDGIGVYGESPKGKAGFFINTDAANDNAALQVGTNGTASAIYAESDRGTSVYAYSLNGNAILGSSSNSIGVFGLAQSSGSGVYGEGINGPGVYGHSYAGSGVYGNSIRGYAGFFEGNVYVSGTLTKGGMAAFKIDHPLDPANKYLSHSCVESPEMKNIYDGNAVLDANGEAEVELPAWFEALNTDFRYQLTCIGGYAQVYIADKIHNNRFKIAGGKPAMEVSWQVTGIRQDPYANAHRIQVEEEKPSEDRGYYLHPELHGELEEKRVHRALHPELTQQAKQMEEWRIKQQAKQMEEWRIKQQAKREELRKRLNER